MSIVALAGWISVTPQNPTFSSRVEAVRVDVLVTRDGQPVPDLTAADFELLDNGVPQHVDLLSFEQIALNVVLGFDMSSSVIGRPLEHLRSAADALLAALAPQDRAALVSFSEVVAARTNLTENLTDLKAAVAALKPGGQTSLIDGVYAAMTLAHSDPGRALLIVFSDGLDTSSWLTSDAVLDAAKRSDVVTYAVSTGGPPRPVFLQDLCELSGGRLFRNESDANLQTIFLRVLDEFRHRYLLSYSPKGVAATGYHRLDVRVKARKVTVRARAGYVRGS